MAMTLRSELLENTTTSCYLTELNLSLMPRPLLLELEPLLTQEVSVKTVCARTHRHRHTTAHMHTDKHTQ